jgi:hypothetical protein
MPLSIQKIAVLAAALLLAHTAHAADQTVTGAGNARAMKMAAQSPLVSSSMEFLKGQLKDIRSKELRSSLSELMQNPANCIQHRANLSEQDKQRLLDALDKEGLVDASEAGRVQGGLMAGVFPPVLQDGGACPQVPLAFYAAPGGATGGHHSEPGGLPVHEAFNSYSAMSLALNYRLVYGTVGRDGLPRVARKNAPVGKAQDAFVIDNDIAVGAPMWHDWAKTMVFQWNADGTEFVEMNFGGNGKTDNNGAAGNSKTGAHHILGVAEAMKRGMAPDFIISVASAHSYPTYGNEYKVVNWLRAASILAGVDPYAIGVLRRDAQGNPRLAAVRKLGEVDLNAGAEPQENNLMEYVLHNLSDADYVFTGPAAGTVKLVLEALAPEYGYNTKDADYLFHFRHTALTYLSAERLLIVYSNGGLSAVRKELNKLKRLKLI